MARIAELSGTAILDTSWLLELYRVPGYFDDSRTIHVRTETARLINAGRELFVTVPVLFEVASHINHVRNGRRSERWIRAFHSDAIRPKGAERVV